MRARAALVALAALAAGSRAVLAALLAVGSFGGRRVPALVALALAAGSRAVLAALALGAILLFGRLIDGHDAVAFFHEFLWAAGSRLGGTAGAGDRLARCAARK